MARDDLTIDFVNKANPQRNMPQPEQLDAAGIVEEFANRAANLGHEIAFMQDEILAKDEQYNRLVREIAVTDGRIQTWIKTNTSHVPNPKENTLREKVRSLYRQAEILSDEKVALAAKTQILLDKQTYWIDLQIKALIEKGDMLEDPDLPSILNPQPIKQAPRTVEPTMPLTQIANPSVVPHQRHPNQHPLRVLPPQVQTHNLPGGATSSSAPATPAAALLNQQRRESSLGAGQKRPRTGGLGTLPPNSSGLLRHPSLTPGTPRGHTPTNAVRQSSIGPRASQKPIANKKVAPQGSRQSGAPRKKMPKSGLSRVKRTGNKNSPSSTNDSELSDADTGSADDDDEPRIKDGDGDEEMLDEDDGDETDKKYCTCQSVSYGDMVACDNESCPYEWFHWSCVGLKSEPEGTWICPVCIKNQKK